MCSPMKTLFLTPAAMLPTVSASNTAAATLHAGAADAANTISAAAACARVLGRLWTRCKLALQRLFGVTSHEGTATPAPTPSSSASKTSSAPASTTTTSDTPAPTDTAAAANTARQASDGATATLAAAHATRVPAIATTIVAKTAATTAAMKEADRKPEWQLVVPRAVAEHVVSVHDPLTTAVMEQLIARHEALGQVPRDTVSQLISCPHAQHHDRESELPGTADPLVMVDVVLRALERHEFDVAATHAELSLSRHWMRCYCIVWLEHSRLEIEREMDEMAQEIEELRHSISLVGATA